MLRRRSAIFALVIAFALLAAACGDSEETTTTTTEPPATTTTQGETTTTTEAPTTSTAPTTTTTTTTLPPPPPGKEVLACQVSDTGGIDDRSFNETAWRGAQLAEEQLEGVTAQFLESQAASDYRPNIDSFISQGCDVVITVGFLLANDTADAAVDNPDQLFAIIDQSPRVAPDTVAPFEPWSDASGSPRADFRNLRGITFQTDEAAFLAGYLAAGMSESGIVGTFGGINIPPVTIFMNGFYWGVQHYNTVKGTDVTVLGWDPAAPESGLFTNDFESLENGRAFAQNLVDEGADIILPVAGPVGLGSAALCQETGACLMIGVDADQFLSAPDFAAVWLTSIKKNMDVAVFNTINNVLVLDSVGNDFIGTLANGGVGLAPYHDFESAVPAELVAEVEQLQADIIAGTQGVRGPPAEE